MSLSRIFFSISNNSVVLKIWRTLTSHKIQNNFMPTSSIDFVVHLAFFSSILLVIITLTLHILEKNSDIIKGERDNNEGVLN